MKLIASLQREVAVLKMGEDQVKLNELAYMGTEKALLEQVKALQAERDALNESSKAVEKASVAHEKLIEAAKKTATDGVPAIVKYSERLKELQFLLKSGDITQGEYKANVFAAIPKEVKDAIEATKSPLQKYKESISTIFDFHQAGKIDKKTFLAGAKDALPQEIKSIIERAKSPLDKFKEQYSQLLDWKKVLTPEQFDKELSRLKGEFAQATQTTPVQFAASAQLGSQEARMLSSRIATRIRNPMTRLNC